MKSVAVLGFVLILVSGIAVNGSRAQPLNAASIAFEHCLRTRAVRTDQCQPLIRSLVAQTEFEVAGADRAAYDGAAAAGSGDAAEIGESRASPLGWAYLFFEVAKYLLDWYRLGGSPYQGTTVVTETIFDPIR